MPYDTECRIGRVVRLNFVLTASLFLSPLSGICAQNKAAPDKITVTFIDPRSGKPLQNVQVEMDTWNGESRPGFEPKATSVLVKTDQQGRATVDLPMPRPEHVSFLPPFREYAYCSTRVLSPEVILQNGVVAEFDPHCGKLNWHGEAKPGEVIVFDIKLTAGEKLRQEIP